MRELIDDTLLSFTNEIRNGKKKKALHPAGIEPTTSWFMLYCSAKTVSLHQQDDTLKTLLSKLKPEVIFQLTKQVFIVLPSAFVKMSEWPPFSI